LIYEQIRLEAGYRADEEHLKNGIRRKVNNLA
jgi:hypothetical protein